MAIVEENGTEALTAEIDQKMDLLRGYLSDPKRADECLRRLEVSWVYHDFALEGVVLSFPELNSCLDDAIVSDISLIPAYEDVKNLKSAIAFLRSGAEKRKLVIDADYLKNLHTLLSTEICQRSGKAAPKPPPGQFRKDMPLHRLYFHEIAAPDKIAYQIRKFVSWFEEEETVKMHPVKRAALAHHRLISIYPWPRHSGKISRLVMNALLMHDHYLPIVINAIERQRYYEVLRQPAVDLVALVMQSLITTIDAALRFFDVNPKTIQLED